MNSTSSQPDDDKIDSRAPLWWAVIANTLSLVLSLQFFWVPSDARIRPIGWVVLVVFIGVAALPVLPLTLFNLKRLRGRTWPRYAVILALTPIPLALLISRFAQLIVGFHFSE